MMTGEILLAALLLSAPQETTPDIGWALVLRPNIIALAMEDEILDTREKGFIMGQDLLGDLTMLQGRHKDFLTAPLVAEYTRFYDKQLVNEMLAANRGYRNYLAQLRAMDLAHADELGCLIQDVDARYTIFDAVRDSAQDYYYVTTRRVALSLLRDLIGHQAFYSGRLPSHIPVPTTEQR